MAIVTNGNENPAYPAAVFARLSSRRIPGKALYKIGEQHLIDYVFSTLSRTSGVSEVVLATSTETSDDPLAAHARAVGVPVIRGSLNDASSRFVKVINELSREAVFRVNGDSPFVSMHLLNKAVEKFASEQWDLITNVFPRTYPPGVSIELIRSTSYLTAQPCFKSKHDREHVTTYLYANHDQFRIYNIEAESTDWSGVHLAVDSPADLISMERILRQMDRPHCEYTTRDIVGLYRTGSSA